MRIFRQCCGSGRRPKSRRPVRLIRSKADALDSPSGRHPPGRYDRRPDCWFGDRRMGRMAGQHLSPRRDAGIQATGHRTGVGRRDQQSALRQGRPTDICLGRAQARVGDGFLGFFRPSRLPARSEIHQVYSGSRTHGSLTAERSSSRHMPPSAICAKEKNIVSAISNSSERMDWLWRSTIC